MNTGKESDCCYAFASLPAQCSPWRGALITTTLYKESLPMMKHLKQLHGIRGLLPYLKTKRPTVLLIFFLSVIDAGAESAPHPDHRSGGGPSLHRTQCLLPYSGDQPHAAPCVLRRCVRVEACRQPHIRSYEYHAVDRVSSNRCATTLWRGR